MDFKQWIINENLSGFVANLMGKDRYNQVTLLIAADWLEDQGDYDLSQAIRLAHQAHHGDYNGQLPAYLKRAESSLPGVSVEHNNSSVRSEAGLFRIQADGLKKLSRQTWMPVDPAKLPENTLKGILLLIADRMSRSSPENPENLLDVEEALYDVNSFRFRMSPTANTQSRLAKALNHLGAAAARGIPSHADGTNIGFRLARLLEVLPRWHEEFRMAGDITPALEKAFQAAINGIHRGFGE